MVIWLLENEEGQAMCAGSTLQAAKRAALKEGIVTRDSDFYCPQEDCYYTLQDFYGSHWPDVWMNFDEEQLKNMGFYSRKMTLEMEG